MDSQAPVAFLSYVRADDEHDHGRITALRSRLEGEVRMHTGQKFKIFQDKRDLSWGQHWQSRLDSTLLSVTFLIPIITPSYFSSSACRDEFEKFSIREKQLGENRLILPIYYLSSDPMINTDSENADDIAKVLASRNWADWRDLRFKDVRSAEVEAAVSEMANTIKVAMKELEAIIAASNIPQPMTPDTPHASRRGRKESTQPRTIETIEPKDMGTFTPITPVVTEAKSKTLRSILSESSYRIYTNEYDEIIFPEEISTIEELSRLRQFLEGYISALEKFNAEQIRSFRSKFQFERKSPTSIYLLIDNSGSMRGTRITNTAAWVCILSNLLQEKGIETEVLGYTTRAWKGGKSRDKWASDGKPENPGRLNDTRHIIYKSLLDNHDSLITRASLMLREGILKENIDGEALLWAADRVGDQDETRSAIIVLSDGAPVDDSTLSANSADYLESHLTKSIKWIEDKAKIPIHGAGIEYDVHRYYRSSTYSKKAQKLGLEIMKFLIERQEQGTLFAPTS